MRATLYLAGDSAGRVLLVEHSGCISTAQNKKSSPLLAVPAAAIIFIRYWMVCNRRKDGAAGYPVSMMRGL